MISIILLLLLLLCVISIWCSYHVLSLTTFTLSSEKVNTPMRTVLISDQHDHIFRDDNEELIERILELEPDVVFMDGDMLNADSDDISWLLSEIERLSAKVPVYYALGNHELAYMAAHPDLITQLEEAGAIVLDEQYVDVEGSGASSGEGFCSWVWMSRSRGMRCASADSMIMRFPGPTPRRQRIRWMHRIMRFSVISATHRG